jgi:hypothetical protein
MWWVFGIAVLVLLVLWFFSRTGTASIGEGKPAAYYGSFKQLGPSGIEYTAYSTAVRMPAQYLAMPDGKILFYQDSYDPNWKNSFNILNPQGDLANDCLVPKIYSFDPATEQFSAYDKVRIQNPLVAQAQMLPNGKLFVLGFAVPVGYCWEGLPSPDWAYVADYSRKYRLAFTYDLQTGQATEVKISNPPVGGLERIAGNLRIGYNVAIGGGSADVPVIVPLPNRGLLISTFTQTSAGTNPVARTYIYDYRKNSLEWYDQNTGLSNTAMYTSLLPLSDGRSLLYDSDSHSLRVFDAKSLTVSQYHEARFGAPKQLHMWQLDARQVLLWNENPNSDLFPIYSPEHSDVYLHSPLFSAPGYGSNPSQLYLYDLKTNQLYQRTVDDWPLTQYANQLVVNSSTLLPALQELSASQKRFQLWPLSSGILLVAGFSYQNLPWSFGLFDLENLSQLPAVNQTDLDQLKPDEHFLGKRATLSDKSVSLVTDNSHNIAFPIALPHGQILFMSSGPLEPQFVLYQPNPRQTSFQLRHRLSDLSGWQEVTYKK